MTDLIALFDSLPALRKTANEKARFVTSLLPDYERYRLAKDVAGAPGILISVGDMRRKARSASIVLENLSVQHDVDCRIVGKSGAEDGCFTIVQCTSSEKALHEYFLSVVAPLLVSLGTSPTRQDISAAVSRLVELFQALTQAPRKTAQGLWAELYLIARAQNAMKLCRAWHLKPEDRYDFSSGGQLLEVKSSAGQTRQHHFSLEQLCPPSGTVLIIASLLAERSNTGRTVGDLIELIGSRISGDPELIAHVNRIVTLTLGNSWQKALTEGFDEKVAERSLAFFSAENIPKINPDTLPPEVSGVNFKVNLTGLHPLSSGNLRAAGELFRAALKK